MGATAKMFIQIVVCLNMVAAHECELLCDKTGLDFKRLQEVLHVSAGQSFVLDHWLGRFKRRKSPNPFDDSARRSSPKACHRHWNWRATSACPFPVLR